jgi:hypothetical protein
MPTLWFWTWALVPVLVSRSSNGYRFRGHAQSQFHFESSVALWTSGSLPGWLAKSAGVSRRHRVLRHKIGHVRFSLLWPAYRYLLNAWRLLVWLWAYFLIIDFLLVQTAKLLDAVIHLPRILRFKMLVCFCLCVCYYRSLELWMKLAGSLLCGQVQIELLASKLVQQYACRVSQSICWNISLFIATVLFPKPIGTSISTQTKY